MTADLASPLQGIDLATPAAVTARELPFRGQLDLQAGAAAAQAIASVLGTTLPASSSAVSIGDTRFLWLGPEQWLVVTAPGAGELLATQLRETVGDLPVSVTDVSGQRTTIELSGPGARDVLAKGCSLDLHPVVRPVGTCVQTLLAQCGVIVDIVAEDCFHLLVRASFARYLAAWLTDAAQDL